MSDPPRKYQRFFAELKRRHVFRVMAVYGIVGFVVLQVVDLAVPALLLPQWTYRLVAFFLLIGFPVAIVLAWAFEQTPHGLKRTERAEPGELEAIVSEPVSRRWPAGVLALIGAGLLLGGWWIGRGTTSGADASADVQETSPELLLALDEDDSRPSLAVLPFADMSPEGNQAYFSDGITEEILNTLARISDLKVLARTSAFGFKDHSSDARAIGDSLGVEYLVEGSVRKAGSQLRIAAQLIDTGDGSQLWAEQYNRQLDDVFAIQTEIAEAIAQELRVPLGLNEDEQLVSPTADLDAYDLYLTGRARMRERGDKLQNAIDLFAAAIDRDSTWAPAWAGLAEAMELLSWYPQAWPGGDPGSPTAREAQFLVYQESAERAARQALELDPNIASAHVALGSIYRNRHDWEEAEAAYHRALALDPDGAEVHQQYAEYLTNVGRVAEGRRVAERAVVLDRVPVRLWQLAVSLAADGATNEAIEAIRQGIDLDKEAQVRLLRTAWPALSLEAGRYDEIFLHHPERITRERQELAIEALRTGNVGLYPRGEGLSGQVWMSFGQPDSAAMSLLRNFELWPWRQPDYLIPVGHPSAIWRPIFDSIRGHSAFQKTLEALNLEGATVRRTTR